LHPKQHRPITHREAARLQGFPDSFIFKGSKIEIARQIGNAVPPPLSAALAACVENLLNWRYSKRGRCILSGNTKPRNGKYKKQEHEARALNS